MSKRPGIYTITNTVTLTVYVGSTNNFVRRRQEHRGELRAGRHVNPYLQSAWNKYGEECFKFELIEDCSSDLLYEREQYHLDLLQSVSGLNFYNVSPITKGSVMSLAERLKMSERHKGNVYTLGMRHSDAAKTAISVARTGVKKSPETIERMRLASLKREAAKRSPPLPYIAPEWLTGWNTNVKTRR
jgi:group I intron endonuclease